MRHDAVDPAASGRGSRSSVPGVDGVTRRADAEIVARLARENFQGPLWARFAEHLAAHGLRVIVPWITTREIFPRMHEKHVRCSGAVHIPQPDAIELAADTITRAIPAFRTKMLQSGRWVPDGGASLDSLFVTQCLHQFPNVYRGWLGRQKSTLHELPVSDAVLQRKADERHHDHSGWFPAQGAHDPAEAVLSRQRCEYLIRLLPDRLRAVVQLVAQGHSLRSAAELQGESYDTLKRELQRIRPALRREIELLGEDDR